MRFIFVQANLFGAPKQPVVFFIIVVYKCLPFPNGHRLFLSFAFNFRFLSYFYFEFDLQEKKKICIYREKIKFNKAHN